MRLLASLALASVALLPPSAAALESFGAFQAADAIERDPATARPVLFGAGAASASSFVYILVELLHAFKTFTDTDIRFTNLGNESRVMCRLTNFSTDCQNPWAGSGNDSAHPAALDFAIFERSQDFQSVAQPDLRLFPLAATPITVVHNVLELSAPLVVSQRVLARIFRGNITAWNDSAIAALNPGQDQALADAGSIAIVSQSTNHPVIGSFKVALSTMDPEFVLAGSIDDPDFPNVNVTQVKGFYAVPTVLSVDYPRPPGAAYIAFLPLTEDLLNKANGVLPVLVTPTGNRTDALEASVDAARITLFESALATTQTGSHFIHFAASARGWPFLQGTYVGLRMETLRPGATCANSVELMHMLLSLFDNDGEFTPGMQDIADATLSLLVPIEVRAAIYAEIKSNLKCAGGQVVSELAFPAAARNLYALIPDGLDDLFTVIKGNYEASSGNTGALRKSLARDWKPSYLISYATVNSTSLNNFNTTAQAIHADGAFLVLPSTVVPMIQDTVTSLPFLAMNLLVLVNLCGSVVDAQSACQVAARLNLTLAIVADMYDGNVTVWNDPRIAQLNPDVVLPSAPIKPLIMRAESVWHYAILNELTRVKPGFAFSSPNLFTDRFGEMFNQVSAFPLAMTILPHSELQDLQTADTGITVAALAGNVMPGQDSLYSCLALDGLDVSLRHTAGCYELTVMLVVVLDTLEGDTSVCIVDAPASYTPRPGFVGPLVVPAETGSKYLADFTHFILDIVNLVPSDVTTVEDLMHDASLDAAEQKPLGPSALAVWGWGQSQARPLFGLRFIDNEVPRAQNTKLKHALLNKLSEVTCNDYRVFTSPENMNLVPSEIFLAARILVGLTLALFVGLSVWVWFNQDRKVVRYASPNFLQLLIFGACVSVLTILPLSEQDEAFTRVSEYYPADLRYLNTACASIPWLFSTGFVIMFSALLVKTWRLLEIFDNPHMRHRKDLHDRDLIKRVAPVLIVVLFVNAVWSGTDILHWDRVATQVGGDGVTVTGSIGLCTVHGNPWNFVGTLLAIMLLMLLFGLWLCYRTRALPSEFQESSWITLAILMQFVSLVLLVPMLALSASSATATYVLKVLVVWMSSCGTVFLLLGPKVWALWRWGALWTSSGSKDKSNKPGSEGAKNQPKPAEVNPGKASVRMSKQVHDVEKGSGSDAQVTSLRSDAMMTGTHHHNTALQPTSQEESNREVSFVASLLDMAKYTVEGVKASSAELMAVTAGTLHMGHTHAFYEIMKDPALRSQLFDRLSKRYQSEGLEFFAAVIDRNRLSQDKMAATREILRKYIVNDAPLEVNISSKQKDRIIAAVLQEDTSPMLADDFFREPIQEACRDILMSSDFAVFLRDVGM